MNYAILTLNQVTAMLCIAVITVIIYKYKLIEKESSKSFSNLLLMVVNPILVFQAFQQDYTKERLQGFFISILLAATSFLFMIIVTNVLVPKRKKGEIGIERFGCIYSNCGFVGIPLVQAVFGIEGVFYLSAFIMVFNIMVWTHGIMLITEDTNIKQLKEFIKTPMFIAIVLGLVSFFGRIRLPYVANQVVLMLANMNTPLAMIVAGMAIADANLVAVIKKKRIYYIALIKLLVLPIMFMLLIAKLPIPILIKSTIAIAMACPTATTGTMFAIRYKKNFEYMAEIFSITTVLSIFTIPIVIYLTQIL